MECCPGVSRAISRAQHHGPQPSYVIAQGCKQVRFGELPIEPYRLAAADAASAADLAVGRHGLLVDSQGVRPTMAEQHQEGQEDWLCA